MTQTRIERQGIDFRQALEAFLAFADEADFICFNGEDDHVIRENCSLNGLPGPPSIREKARNLRHMFMHTLKIADKDLNSGELTRHFGLPAAGQTHDGLADARAIAAALKHLLAGA